MVARPKNSAKKSRSVPTDAIDRFDWYVEGVRSGAISAGRLVKLAVERHVRDLARGRRFDYEFDPEFARHAIEFFPRFLIHHVDRWAGEPFELAPWQTFIVGVLFGWRHKKTKLRRWREAYIEVARKNGKSTMLAGICIYCLVGDALPGAWVVTAATKKDQARIIFDTAKRMIQASPALRAICDVTKLLVEVPDTGSKMEPLSSDANSMDGLNPSTSVIDELHAHRTRDVYDKLDTATGARAEALVIEITTAGDDNDSICRIVHDQAESVLEQMATDDRLFAFVAAIDKEDDWSDEENWPKANPNLGISVSIEDLRAKSAKAKANSANVGSFLRYHCNRWQSGADKAILPDKWRVCGIDEGKHFRWADFETRELAVTGGLDLASCEDLAALVFCFQFLGKRFFLPFFWAPEVGIEEKETRHRVPYRQYAELEFIELLPGETMDIDEIGERVADLAERYGCESIAFDPQNAVPTAARLEREHGLDMVRFAQTFEHYNNPTRRFLDDIVSRRITHPHHPIFDAHAFNLSVCQDGGNRMRPVKEKAKSARKIDGMVAAIMAYDISLTAEEEGGSLIAVIGE